MPYTLSVHSEPLASIAKLHSLHGVHAMSQPMFPHEWRILYAAAMLESDSTQVWQRIAKADAAIQARLIDLPEISSGQSEREELQSALNYLCGLKVPQPK